ncbi:MAG: YkvA family protein [Methyloceanibacter sp.]
MIARDDAGRLRDAALGREIVLGDFAERERKVRRDFWAKLKRFAGRVPFVEDIVAAYYCALDPATPMRVRGMLLAALAYFILPFDLIPDMLPVLGFADDAALLTAVFGLVAAHITDTHRGAAARALDKELPKRT